MKIRIDLKILLFVVLFFLTGQLKIYILIMLFGLIHEMSHLIVGVLLKSKLKEIEIMPFGYYVKLVPKIEDYNKKILKSNMVELKKIFIVLAGPLINLILIIYFSLLKNNTEELLYANLIILLFNMIPIYPLDGGRLIKSILKLVMGNKIASDYIKKITNIFVIIVTICSSLLVLYLKNITIIFILIYLWNLNYEENKRYYLKQEYYKMEL